MPIARPRCACCATGAASWTCRWTARRSSTARRSTGSISTAAGAMAASRRRRPPAGASPTPSPATSRTQFNAAYRLDRFATGRAHRREAARARSRTCTESCTMRIACPHCGERGNEEFAYLGDATVHRARRRVRRDARRCRLRALDGLRLPARQPRRRASRAVAARRMAAAAWLVVTRNISTHAILGVEDARAVATARIATAGAR